MHHVFIYGTLKRGYQNEALRPRDARFAALCRTLLPYPLVLAGRWFSPCLLDEPGMGLRVAGELFIVGEAGFAELDRLEGVGLPGGYHRVSLRVESLDDGSIHDAVTYARTLATAGDVHDGPLADYPRDPRYVPPAARDQIFG